MHERHVRVGVIGTGFGARVHLPALAAVTDAEIVAICGRNPARVEAIADAYDIRNTFTDYRALIACPEVDAVTIALPTALHHAAAVAAIAARKHVLCERPMAMSATEAREMARMAETSDLTAMLCHELRFLPARARLKELVEDGYLGAVSLVQFTFLRPAYTDHRARPDTTQPDPTEDDGVLGTLGAHAVDALRWWFGEILEVAGAAHSGQSRRTATDTASAEAIDSFTMLLRFASGAIGSVTCSATAWHGPGEEIRAFGSAGMLTIAPDGSLWGARRDDFAPAPLPIPPYLMGSGIPEVDATPNVHPLIPPFIRLARQWVDGILTGTSPSPSFADGLRVQEALDAVHRSQLQHKWVDISGARWPTAPSR